MLEAACATSREVEEFTMPLGDEERIILASPKMFTAVVTKPLQPVV
jgi:hypothetical protein